jgi:glycosyltransferase involved in cell wall biosynthesis
MNPLVSVVIPTYSRPVYLERAIKSVLNQTHSNIEIIVVDDNNPDTEHRQETEKVMEGFINNGGVIYLQHEWNKGGSAARNTGWRVARGKYITFLDDDDEISPKKIEKQIQCLENLDSSWGMCYTAYVIKRADGSLQTSSETRSGDCYTAGLMRTLFMGSGSNLLLRKKIVDEIGGYDESFARNQDIEFLARSLEHYKLAYIDEVLLTIYQERNRPVRTYEQLEEYAEHYFRKFEERISKLDPKDKERVIAVISLERCRVAFYIKHYKDGLYILKCNHVKFIYVYRYIKYLLYRFITQKSYGFYGN